MDEFVLIREAYAGGAWQLQGLVSGMLELLRVHGAIVTFKEHGRHVHSGQGQRQRYCPARFRVFEVTAGSIAGGRAQVRELIQWPCRLYDGYDPYGA